MSSLTLSIQEIDDAVYEYSEKLMRYSPGSKAFVQTSRKLADLAERQQLLSILAEELKQQVQLARIEFDRKLEELHGALRRAIDSIVHNYEDKVAELPPIGEVGMVVQVEPSTLIPINSVESSAEANDAETVQIPPDTELLPEVTGSTVQTVKEYSAIYFDEYQNLPNIENNFFHSISCSGHLKYVEAPSNDDINSASISLLSLITLPATMQYPMSLIDVDSIIHSCTDEQLRFVILDTSLRVILTNFSEILPSPYIGLLSIYDSSLKRFIPVPCGTKNGKYICTKCFQFDFRSHECQQHCPFCWREDEVSLCSKPFPESKPFICTTCNAFCQTETCYDYHLKLCPLTRPNFITGFYNDILQFMDNLIIHGLSANENKKAIVDVSQLAKSLSPTGSTPQIIQKYSKRYFDEYKHISEEDKFFHASICSNQKKFVETPTEENIKKYFNLILENTVFPPNVQYPLSLTDVDKIIHSFTAEGDIFIIFDTSLRIILTNMPAILPKTFFPHLLIYDSFLKQFTPVSFVTKDKKALCLFCFRYGQVLHECERHCPICLRNDDVFKCCKPPLFWFTWYGKPLICSRCSAFCQTFECYETHQKICPLPVQRFHNDVFQLIMSTFV